MYLLDLLFLQSSAGVGHSVLRESQNTTPHWKHREQPLRFEHEQQSLYRSQNLKRSSEVCKIHSIFLGFVLTFAVFCLM